MIIIIFLRVVGRFNLTHTIGDIHSFIRHTRPADTSRAFVLQTQFPVKQLDDLKLTLEAAGVKGAVILQRYT
jgi:UBX domain-containing protein 1